MGVRAAVQQGQRGGRLLEHLRQREPRRARPRASTSWPRRSSRTSPRTGKRVYADGSTVAQQYKAWHDHWSNYIDERAKRGLFIETGAPTYTGYTIEAILNIYDFADDPVLRRKAGMILDLDFADYAQQELHDVWGGAKSRSYPERLVQRRRRHA